MHEAMMNLWKTETPLSGAGMSSEGSSMAFVIKLLVGKTRIAQYYSKVDDTNLLTLFLSQFESRV
jgi:hypothetical protein